MLPHRLRSCMQPHRRALRPAAAVEATSNRGSSESLRPRGSTLSIAFPRAPKKQVALLYFGSHNLRGNRSPCLSFARFPCARIAISLSTRQVVPLHQSRFGILKNRSLWISVGAALVTAAVLAGCGTTSYPDGRSLPPSGLVNRVVIAIQNPGVVTNGALQIVDAYYDERSGYNGTPRYLYHHRLQRRPAHHHPKHARGAVWRSVWRGRRKLCSRQLRVREGHRVGGRPERASSSIFVTRNEAYVFAASQTRICSRSHPIQRRFPWAQPSRRIPRQRQSHRNGGAGLCPELPLRLLPAPAHRRANDRLFRRSFHVAQGRGRLRAAERPTWCLFQMQSPDTTDATGNYYGAPLAFDHPVKAVFSSDGGTAYILSCGPECGGATAALHAGPHRTHDLSC